MTRPTGKRMGNLMLGVLLPVVMTLHRIDPRPNMWVTWANETGQQAFCLSLASATRPFRTCLVGVPSFSAAAFSGFATGDCKKSISTATCSATLINSLNVTLPWNPQELDLLGAMRIGNSSKNWTQTCLVFGGGPGFGGSRERITPRNWTNISPMDEHYQNLSAFCGIDGPTKKPLGAYGSENRPFQGPYNIGPPRALPPGVFLICGDRAWQGIPGNAYGGPCYLGKLTLLAPDTNWWKSVTSVKIATRRKRAVTGLSPDCDDRVSLLSPTERVFLSLFVPGAAAGDALKQIGRLACWAEKQANVTTQVIESLLEDQKGLRHAILQDRAAIDFLLLAQGHGCEEFDGMCCMNLSDHSESIHKQLRWLKEHTGRIRQNHGFLDEWLTNLFGNLPQWLTGLLAEGLRILLILIIIGLCLCVVLSCVKKALLKVAGQVWIARKQEGEILEEWLGFGGGNIVCWK
ncbi:uncharacterized protein [Apteryx mantelli]|uniref:Envelope protein n=1 Tax=Apteryx mantelli TaxID=2696672 RepID=A0ABM4EKC3_9AVES